MNTRVARILAMCLATAALAGVSACRPRTPPQSLDPERVATLVRAEPPFRPQTEAEQRGSADEGVTLRAKLIRVTAIAIADDNHRAQATFDFSYPDGPPEVASQTRHGTATFALRDDGWHVIGRLIETPR